MKKQNVKSTLDALESMFGSVVTAEETKTAAVLKAITKDRSTIGKTGRSRGGSTSDQLDEQAEWAKGRASRAKDFCDQRMAALKKVISEKKPASAAELAGYAAGWCAESLADANRIKGRRARQIFTQAVARVQDAG